MATPATANPTANTYPWGQCTYYIKQQYPQLPNWLGNACNWWAQAQSHGWYRSQTPWNGAVSVYACNFPGSGGYGHVGIVTQVNKDGSYTERGMHMPILGLVSQRTVTSRQYLLGFFQAPGGPGPKNPAPNSLPDGSANASRPNSQSNQSNQSGDTQDPPCPKPNPSTGANGARCSFPIEFGGWRVHPFSGLDSTTPVIGQLANVNFCFGAVSICIDGVIGVAAIGLGAAIMVLGIVLAVERPVQHAVGKTAQVAGSATKVAGEATGQPEVAAAGSAAQAAGSGMVQDQEVSAGMRQRARQLERAQQQQERRSERTLSSQRLSVQQQQTKRELERQGYTSVQATQLARQRTNGTHPDHGIDAAKA